VNGASADAVGASAGAGASLCTRLMFTLS